MKFSDVALLRPDFIRIACSIGASRYEAEDIVQELLISLFEMDNKEGSLDRISKDGKLNMSYIFRAISNLKEKDSRWKKHLKRDAEIPPIVIDPPDDCEIDVDIGLKTMHFYYPMLFKAYLEDGSMRVLAKGSRISLKTIWNDLRYIKQKLRKHLDEYT